MNNERQNLLEQIEQAKAKLKELDSARLEALRLEAGELGYDLVPRDAPKRRGRKPRAEGEPKRAYNIDPARKVEATEKRTYTRAINSGKSEAEAKKLGKEAGKALAAKLGLK